MYVNEQQDCSAPPGDAAPKGLLDEIVSFLKRYVIVDEHEYVALALWIVHTHAIDAADTTPYLAALGPEKRCGKTRLLETLTLLVRQPMMTMNVSEAALFRMIAQDEPTLLLDETDTIFGFHARKENEALRGLINGGYRRGAVVYRCVGDAQQVTAFATFCPKALAGIGDLPDTILDRSLVITMRRNLAGEQVERLRMSRPPAKAAELKQRVEAWVHDHSAHLASAKPTLPEELNDRAQDVCEPLLAIADLFGEAAATTARAALVTIAQTQATVPDSSPGAALLADIKLAFEQGPAYQLSSEELIERLCEDAEARWGQWSHQGKITPRALARLLAPYGIHSLSLGDGHHRGRKGYKRGQFVDAWDRYLIEPPESRDNRDNCDVGPAPTVVGVSDDYSARDPKDKTTSPPSSRDADAATFTCVKCTAAYDPTDPGSTSLRCSSCAEHARLSQPESS